MKMICPRCGADRHNAMKCLKYKCKKCGLVTHYDDWARKSCPTCGEITIKQYVGSCGKPLSPIGRIGRR